MGKEDRKPLAGKVTAYGPEFLIILLCAVLLLGDISHKKGYHMDELLSFELANALFNPWIVPTQPQGRLAKFVEDELRGETFGETCKNLADTVQDILQNRGNSKILSYQADVYPEPVWITRQQFLDYITVDDGDAFQYLSVYFNVKDDNHPPLHFMALHTVCSLFRGRITPLMGCGINLVCVLGVMGMLMWLGRRLLAGEYSDGSENSCGRWTGLFAAALYGLSAGALSTTLLIRMYAMVTFFCVAFFAIHIDRLYGRHGFAKGSKLLFAVTVLGFWTQYFFLFYCLILAAVTVVVLWRGKRRKELWAYVRTELSAAVAGVLVFPFSIPDVFSSGRGVEALTNLSLGLSGYGERLAAFGKILTERLGVGCVALMLAALAAELVLLFCRRRNTDQSGGRDKKPASSRTAEKICVCVLPAAGYFLLAARMSPYLVDRYIMPLFPFAALFMVTAVMWLAVRLRGTGSLRPALGKVLPAAVFLAAVVCQLWDPLRYQDSYLYENYPVQEAIAEQYAGLPCICVGEGVGYYENLLEFTHYEKTLILTPGELENRRERASLDSLEQAVLLLKDGTDREAVCDILEKEYGLSPRETLLETGSVYGDRILLLKRRK